MPFAMLFTCLTYTLEMFCKLLVCSNVIDWLNVTDDTITNGKIHVQASATEQHAYQYHARHSRYFIKGNMKQILS